MGQKARKLQRAAPRVCTARRVGEFDREDIVRRLFAGDVVEGDFRIVEHLSPPSAETCFDVCTDGEDLWVSVLSWESGEFFGTGEIQPENRGGGKNAVEVIFSPYGDRVGYLHYCAGPLEERWFRHHWPYRDKRPHPGARPRWDFDWHLEDMHADIARIVFFRFPLDALVPEGYDGPLGFNVMRTQLRTAESASWSHAGGSGFPDASSFGRLCLSEEQEVPESPLRRRAEATHFQLQGTYDFPDEMVGGPYTPEVMRREMRRLRGYGFERVYWIDYPWQMRALEQQADHAGPGRMPPGRREHWRETTEAFGGDPLPGCVEIAHEVGLEFYTVMKPYDLWLRGTLPFSEDGNEEMPTTLSGRVAGADPFLVEHPEYWFRRNPAWTAGPGNGPVREVALWSDSAEPLPCEVSEIRLFGSEDNTGYRPVPGAAAETEVVERPRYRWTPAGRVRTGGSERVRVVRFSGLDLDVPYLAVQFPRDGAGTSFGNQFYLLCEVRGAEGELTVTPSMTTRRGDFRDGGFEFTAGTQAQWSDASEGMELHRDLAGVVLGIARGQDQRLPGMLDPSHPEVRRYWLDNYVQRAIDVGADGVDVRIAHHHGCPEWLSFAYAEPVMEEFRRREGREPSPRSEDFETIRRIRGEFHTEFLRRAKRMLSAAGMKLEHHVESRMTVPPSCDTYTQIHWDCARWIEEGIVDGVNLKYLGPFNPWVHEEILPRAEESNVPVQVIAAIGDPRSQPRTPEWAEELLQSTHAVGMAGLNLYELWVYIRTTPRGELFTRGCARSVFERLRDSRVVAGGPDQPQRRTRP